MFIFTSTHFVLFQTLNVNVVLGAEMSVFSCITYIVSIA